MKPSIHLQHRMPWDNHFSIRLVIPGIDDGGAVWLEGEISCETHAQAMAMLKTVSEALEIEPDICECQEEDWGKINHATP